MNDFFKPNKLIMKRILQISNKLLKRSLFRKGVLAFTILMSLFHNTFSQIQTVSTYPTIVADNGVTTGGVSFEIESNASVDVTGFSQTFYTSVTNVNVWYRVGGVQNVFGQAANISTASGWVLHQTNIPVTATDQTVPVQFNLTNFISVPANTPVGIFLENAPRYRTFVAGNQEIFTNGTLTIKNGTNYGYGGTVPSPTNHPRQFAGAVHYQLQVPCIDPPFTGNLVSSQLFACPNESVTLSVDTMTFGIGQTLTWQQSVDNTNWVNIPNSNSTIISVTPTTDTYYRLQVTCGSTTTSSSLFLEVGQPLAGFYTINSAFPTDLASLNFQSIGAAVSLLNCVGVSGPVVFNVVQGSGPYNEQIALNNISGASDVNTITFNGNGQTMSFTTTAALRYLFLLDGAKHITINDFVFEGTTLATNFFPVLLTNQADSNTISNNEFLMSTTVTGLTVGGVLISGSLTTWTTTGNNGSYNKIFGNSFVGGYFGVRINGAAATPGIENQVYDNDFSDYFHTGVGFEQATKALVDNNRFTPRATASTANRAIDISNCNNGFTVSNNKASSFGQYFIRINICVGTATDRGLIANNVAANSTNYTSTVGGVVRFEGATTTYVDVFHNSFAIPGVLRGLYSTVAITNLRIINNVFYSESGSLIFDFTNAGFAEEVDYNNYYSTGANIFNVGTNYSSLATFRNELATTSPNDFNSIFGNPVFYDLIDMVPGSILIKNQGTPLPSVTEDILGVARNTTAPDMGAYEYVPFAIDAEASNLVSPVSECGLTNTETVTIRITNNGTSALVNPTVGFSLDGTPYITETTTLNIASGTSANYTFSASVNLSVASSVSTIKFYVNATGDVNPTNDTSIVYSITNFPVFASPITEDFESFVPGLNATGYQNGWSAVPENSTTLYRWIVRSGATATANTGPDVDNTIGNVSGKYIYTQSASGIQGDEATAMLPCLDLTTMTYPGLEFYYHMYGDQIDRLYIDVLNNGVWLAVDSIIGQQQTSGSQPWIRRQVNLSGYINETIKVRFRGIRGVGVRGNMAIDDVSLIELPASDAKLLSASIVESACSLSNSEPVSVTVRNEGGAAMTNFQVRYSINGGTPVSETVTASVAPATNFTYTFNTNADLSVFQVYTFDFEVRLNGDTIFANDSLLGLETENFYTPSQPTVITTQKVCRDNEATLWAKSDSSFVVHNWYQGVMGQEADYLGDTITTMALSDTTLFYIKATTGSLDSIQPYLPNSTTSIVSAIYGIIFSVNQPTAIKEVDVFSMGSAGNITVLLREVPGGNLVNTYTVNVSAGTGTNPSKHTINLNTGILPVGQYAISMTAYSTGVQLIRDNGTYTGGYPVNSPNGEVTILGYHTSFPTLTTGATTYYFFYNLKIGAEGCSSTPAEVLVNVPRVKLGPDTTLCDYNNPYILDGGPNFDTYQWSNGATTQSIEVAWNGFSGGYILTATSGNCTDADTVFVLIDCPLADGLTTDETQLKVYPNPSEGVFTLEFIGLNKEEMALEILDQSGRLVYDEIIANTFNYKKQIELNGLSQGIYFIRLYNQGYSNVEKLIIR
jgi:hypothetical protein